MKRINLTIPMLILAMGVNAQDFKGSLGKADRFWSNGELAEAKKHVDALVKDEKKSQKEKTWYLYGRVYQELECSENPEYRKLVKDVDVATLVMDAYKKVQDMKPNNSDWDRNIDFPLADTQNPGELIDAAKPTFYNCIFDRAGKYFNEQDYELAMAEFKKAIIINPEDTNAYVFMGYSAYQMEDTEAMKTSVNGYYKNGGETPELYNQYANLLIRKEKYQEAEDIVKKAREEYPDNIILMRALYATYQGQEKIDEAIAVLKEIIKVEPNDDEILFRIGYAYAEFKEDMEKGKEYYEKALSKNENNFEANYNVASIYVDEADKIRRNINDMLKKGKLTKANQEKMLNESNELLRTAEKRMKKCYNIRPSDQGVILYLTDIYNMLDDKTNYEKYKAKLDR